MTHEEFNRLYGDGKINIKVFVAAEDDGTEKTVESFMYNDKFYLRIHSVLHYVTGDRVTPFGRKRYKMSRESHFIKEFDTREQANAYFQKISKHFVRIQ